MAASPSASRKTVEVVMTPLGTEMTRTTTPSKKVPGRSFFGFVPDAGDCKSLSFASPKSSPSIASQDRSQQQQQMQRDDDDDDEVMSVIVQCPDADDDGPIRAQSAAQLTAIPIANDGNDHSRLAIVGGKVVNDDIIFEADIYIEDGVIKEVGRDVAVPEGCRTIDAKGKLVLPGGIDPHTHFELEFMGTRTVDDFYHGTRAALAGGTTMIVDFAVGVRGESIVDAYQRSRDAGDGKACCDYGLHVCVLSWDEKVKSDMQLLTTQKGVNSFKMYMTYDALRIFDDEMLCVMEWCKELGALAQIHAENCDALNYNANRLVHLGITGPEGHEQSRPEEVEAEATNRAIVLANQVNCPVYIVHINSKKAADVFVQRRLEGYVAFGEVLAAGLGTDGTHQYNKCWRHAAGHVMSPPLRPDVSTPAHLMNLVSSGAVQVTASDNCTFSAEQKAMGKDDFRFIPNGVNGVEDRMSVVWEKGVMTGKLDPCQFVAATSSNAAKIFNVYPRKGRIAVGSDADLVVWDPRATRTISSKTHKHNVDFNIFEGMECHGVPSYVVSNGRIVVEHGELTVSAGAGRFVPTPVYSPAVYMRVHERETARAPFKVEREAYEGPVADTESGAANGTPTRSKGRRENVETPVTSQAAPQFQYSRPLTSSGGRNMQDSSFSLSGAQIDDNDVQVSKSGRAGIRVHNPPGGKSTGLW